MPCAREGQSPIEIISLNQLIGCDAFCLLLCAVMSAVDQVVGKLLANLESYRICFELEQALWRHLRLYIDMYII